MGNTGAYITYGVIVLVIVPILFSAIGQTFGSTVDGQAPIETGGFLQAYGLWLQSLSDLPFVGGAFLFFGNMFIGFAIIPAWLSLIAITIPTILIIRGTVSATG